MQIFLFVSCHKISNRIIVNRISGHLIKKILNGTPIFFGTEENQQKNFLKEISIRVAAGTEGETVVTNRMVGLRGPRLALTLLVLPV